MLNKFVCALLRSVFFYKLFPNVKTGNTWRGMPVVFTVTSADLRNREAYAVFVKRTVSQIDTDAMFVHWCVVRALKARKVGLTTWKQRLNVEFDVTSRRPLPSTSPNAFVEVHFVLADSACTTSFTTTPPRPRQFWCTCVLPGIICRRVYKVVYDKLKFD